MRRVGLTLTHSDGRTNAQNQKVAIRNFLFATAPKSASEQRMLCWNLILIVIKKTEK